MITRISGLILVMIVVLGLCGASGADGERKKKIIGKAQKEIQGEISWINSRYIAVAYNRDPVKGSEDEILLPIDSNLKLEHKRSLDQIKAGDLVRVQYDEETEEDDKGNKKDSRKAAVISFIKAGPKKEEPVINDELSEDDSLTFKGLKSGEIKNE